MRKLKLKQGGKHSASGLQEVQDQNTVIFALPKLCKPGAGEASCPDALAKFATRTPPDEVSRFDYVVQSLQTFQIETVDVAHQDVQSGPALSTKAARRCGTWDGCSGHDSAVGDSAVSMDTGALGHTDTASATAEMATTLTLERHERWFYTTPRP